MYYDYSEIKFDSRDGKNTLSAGIYIPKDTAPRGIIQISHGMVDHIGRYKNVADFFCKKGYVVAGNDHLGHGKSVQDDDSFGYFAKEGGIDFLLRDLHSFNKILREKFPNLPIKMLGHSMGSFILRLYSVKYPHTISGAIIHGTAGKNSLVGIGKLLARAIMAIKGEKHRSRLLKSMSTGAYNKHFPKADGECAWLTRDLSQVADRRSDPMTSFTFTASAYRDLFTMLADCNSKKWFLSYPKQMPTLIMSGEADPVGNFGKGVNFVYKQLLIAGATDLSLKTYPEARHELFNEFGRAEIFCDMLEFTERVITK